MKKLCYVATIPAVVHAFLRDHIQAASRHYEVTVICNSADAYLLNGLNARLVLLPVERKPSPWSDLWVLLQLFKLFRAERFDIVHSHMPKTGLLGMMAAWAAGTPLRIHTFHGEVWATRKGWQRGVMKLLDHWVGRLATDVLVVSPSQLLFLEKEHVLPPGKANVIGSGSACGVDAQRFQPNMQTRDVIRQSLGIAAESKVILFVGRLNRDKGMLDLAAAFNALARARADVTLLLVGAEEDTPFSRIQDICASVRKRLHYVRFTTAPERYMVAADIFCLPSYREGLPMTILEAAACAVPSVASRIYGITDAILEGETGLLFPAGDVTALEQTLLKLISDDALRQRMGGAARRRAVDAFSSDRVTTGLMSLYRRLLGDGEAATISDQLKASHRVDVSISIVSHLQSELVAKLFEDLEEHCKGMFFEVILTINKNEDLPFLLGNFSFPFQVVRNDISKGFAANHNQAFQLAIGEYFCVMNPDIRLDNNPFKVLIAVLGDASVGLVAPLMFGVDAEIEDSARRFPSPLTILKKAVGRRKTADYIIDNDALHPDWVGGMFMLFPRSIFYQLKGFDERYFLYYEDVDICGRLRLMDHEVVLCPHARVTHHAQRSSHRNLKYLRWHVTSMTRFFLSSVYWRLRFRHRV